MFVLFGLGDFACLGLFFVVFSFLNREQLPNKTRRDTLLHTGAKLAVNWLEYPGNYKRRVSCKVSCK